jgi:CBS domain containing-hemolysin-like protein
MAWTGLAVLSLALNLCLSIALATVHSLSRVALQKHGSEFGPQFEFVQALSDSQSTHLIGASILRQVTLITGFVGALGVAAQLQLEKPLSIAVLAILVLVVFGLESMVARGLAEWRPREALRLTLWSVRLARLALYPVSWLIVRWLSWLDGNGPSEEARARSEEEQDEDVEALIAVGEREGVLEGDESEMVRGIVDLDDTVVRELMTPRTEISGIDISSTVGQARHRFLEAGHSRLPAFRGSVDNIVGVLHSRDLFRAWEAGDEQRTIASYVRPASFVPETLSAAELLPEMRQRSHLAIVVDEYGGVAGIVTLEDVLEEIVGDIRDEHETEEELIHQEATGVWLVHAVVHVKEVEHLLQVEFTDRDFDTVGGMVVAAFGRVPQAGETIVTNGIHVTVLQSDRKRVNRVRVTLDDNLEASGT